MHLTHQCSCVVGRRVLAHLAHLNIFAVPLSYIGKVYNVVSHPGKSSKHKKLNKCSKYLDGGSLQHMAKVGGGGECLFAHYTWINLVHDDSVFIYLTISWTTFFSPVDPNPYWRHTSTLVSCFVRWTFCLIMCCYGIVVDSERDSVLDVLGWEQDYSVARKSQNGCAAKDTWGVSHLVRA